MGYKIIYTKSGEKERRHTRNNYNTEMDDKIKRLAMLGLNIEKIADCFDVSEQTIYRWLKEKPSFRQGYQAGKTEADALVAHSLFKSATGCKIPAVDFKVIDGRIVQTNYMKHYPPSDKAAIFWLKNRQKALWKDNPEGETPGADTAISQIVSSIREQSSGEE